jgi:putative tryptophan/tyrosine transport system substrate-binding protein
MARLAVAALLQETAPMTNASPIGVLWHAGSAEEEKFPLAQFRAGLQDTGYVEGQNIILENRFPAEDPERFYALAEELVQIKVDILFTVTRLAALAAQRATKTIPIVFMAVADPVGSKLVDTLARPGGNITGLANMALELTPKRFELLKEVVGLSRAALLVNATDPAGGALYRAEQDVGWSSRSHCRTNRGSDTRGFSRRVFGNQQEGFAGRSNDSRRPDL